MVSNPFDFSSRVALVTGAGSDAGIGFASARLLARLGARVAITSTTERIRDRAGELVGAEGAEASSHIADLTERQQAFDLVSAVRNAHGQIDVLVNAAGMAQTGIAPISARFRELSADDLERELEVTLMTAFHTTRAVLPEMVERGYGRIVMVSSVTGLFVTAPGSAAYATAKSAMDGMMRTIAIEHGRDGITANSVAPGG
jgi:3-oxoacyl-[acyl-carrier protein] reductase